MRCRDLVLPLAVVIEVAMMVFPLPIWMLDVLLMCNISAALLLLLSSVYLSEPERFTSLPTILLLSTLFRLGLNISTTRQLLGQGEAPDVVVAFGNFVVGGNLVVGAVIFLIITLVQFLVIAKGAERVAEVAARFTLDAMPGKQMAIDADIRAGILGLSEAREKRRELQRESKLYGALDGAMKFVKGDAVAALIITFLNITAGLVVGVFQHGLTFSQALQKYTIFTVGDGLVSQIPALLTATAAGIAVTRVGDKDGTYVGTEVFMQLGKEPQALAMTAIVLLALAFAPGLPFFSFLAAAVFFGTAAIQGAKRKNRKQENDRENEFRPNVRGIVALRFSRAAVRHLQQERLLPSKVQKMRQEMFEQHGIVLADIQFDIVPEYDDISAEIYFREVFIRAVRMNDGAGDSAGQSFSDRILWHLQEILAEYRPELIDDTQTRTLMETHQGVCEDLINSVVPKLLSVTALTRLLRQLVREQVSIRGFADILQAVAEYQARKNDAAQQNTKTGDAELLADIRVALKRTISRRFADADWRIQAWVLNGELDHLLSKAARTGSDVQPELADLLVRTVQSLDSSHPCPTLLTTGLARKILADTLREQLVEARVLAVDELSDEVRLEVLGEIGLPGSAATAEMPAAEGSTVNGIAETHV
jgi:flagellar biosynthesis component FlhA